MRSSSSIFQSASSRELADTHNHTDEGTKPKSWGTYLTAQNIGKSILKLSLCDLQWYMEETPAQPEGVGND